MFLRFTVSEQDLDSNYSKGVFTVAYELYDDGDLESYEIVWLQEILTWFKRNLPVPRCYRKARSRGAICWFRAEASEPLKRIRDLVAFIECRGMAVKVLKTDDPGTRIYRDEFQVVAFPGARRGKI